MYLSKFSFIRVYNTVILYGADGLRCRTIQSLDHCYRGAGAKGLKKTSSPLFEGQNRARIDIPNARYGI